ncbi:diguanylate cyclase [Aliarcobacter butzleri]|uniref:GGDEF domain-containing protein n=1 Tax=Aliarcobacter butzleri TaxID=28197 RepID=UPI00263CE088|nr:diguanylate cyclase [Aliarcobacter butzleri]MDN5101800.1 diguanylate cyclase [Aliarcobacter butzleri]
MDEMLSCEELTLKVNSLEKEVKFNNFFLKKMFDIMPSRMFYKNKNGVYEHCNDAFSRLILGIPKEEILEKKVNQLIRFKHQFSFAIIDVDFFKDYNDYYGHQKSDLVLEEIGKTLKNSFLRSTDYAFRIGGEEFAILFDVNDFKDAYIIMERVRKKIEDLKIEASPKSNYKYLTVSIGLGNILKLDISTNPSIIYHEVDKLLYKSKKDDKNRVTVKDIIF